MLHVIASMDPKWGGVCQAVRTIVKGLGETDTVQNEVASLDAEGALFLDVDPFPNHPLGPARGPWAYSANLIPWLLENLPRFDVVIIHGLWLYHGYAVRKALNLLGSRKLSTPNSQPSTSSQLPRCYVMPHGMLDPYFQRDPSRRLKAIRNLIYWKLIESQVVKSADGLLFTCEDEMLLAHKPFRPYRPRHEWVVGLGVEEPPCYTEAMKIAFAVACPSAANMPYLLFLSRIHPKKGVDLLIRAYADFVKSASQPSTTNPQPLPSLVIAGPFDSTYAQEMLALAAELLPSSPTSDLRGPASTSSVPQVSDFNIKLSESAPRILFPGMLQGDAKWGAFHGCKAFLLPSHQENFGIAVVEALACGKPVLISKQVNIWREIKKYEAGLFCDDTYTAIHQQLLDFHTSDEKTLHSMSRNAIECYRTLYGIDQAANRLLASLIQPAPAF